MKILHVLTAPRAEGTPRLVLDWLSLRDHEQEVVFLTSEGELKTMFQSTGVWQYYNSKFPLRFTNGVKVIRLLHSICRDRKPDVVISWTTGMSQWIHAGARLAGVRKLIIHAGNAPGQSLVSRYLASYFTFWSGLLFGSKVIACSAYIRNEFMKIPLLASRQFYWVHNCVKAERFRLEGLRHTDNSVIMVATLEAHKDHQTLLEAWRVVEEREVPAELILAGDGSLRGTLEALAGRLNLKRVVFLGSRPDIPELLCQSKVFVLSTTPQEGFGTVLVEAMAAGCIIVATDVPACREVLDHGTYGALVEPRNAGKLADAVAIALNGKLTEEMNRKRQEYLEQFTPSSMMKKYLQIVG